MSSRMNSSSTSTSGGVLYHSEFIHVTNPTKFGGDSESSYEENTFRPKAACTACRRLHRRCSREFPKCTECVTHRRKCIYSTDTKERKYQPHVVSTPSTNRTSSSGKKNRSPVVIEDPQIAISEGLIKKSIKRQTFNIYMDLICMGLPFVTPQHFEGMILSDTSIMEHHFNSSSIRALFLSIQSLCDQRFGRRDAAIAAFNQAKSELHQVFEDYDNFLNICTYNNLAYFSGAEGDDQMSQWFMAPVEYFFSKYNESNFNVKNDLVGLAFDNVDKLRGITKLFYFDNRYKWTSLQYGDFLAIPFKLSTGKCLPTQIGELLNRDLNENTAQAEATVLESIFQYMKQYHQKLLHSPSFINLSRIIDISSFAKTRMESLRVLFSKAQSQERREFYFLEMLKYSFMVTQLTRDDLFPYILPTNIFGFALAAEIHLEALANFSHLVSITEIMDYLKQDFQALTILARKYGRVERNYGHIYDNIQSVLLGNGVTVEELLTLISNNSLLKTLTPTLSDPLLPTTPKLNSPISVNNQTSTSVSPTNTSIDQINSRNSPISDHPKKKDFPSAAFLNNTLLNFKKKISNHEIQLTIPQKSSTVSSPASEEELANLKNQTISALQNF